MNCKICHATLHSAREHCPVCGALTKLSPYKSPDSERTIQGRLIASSHGAERVRQNPYGDKPWDVDL